MLTGATLTGCSSDPTPAANAPAAVPPPETWPEAPSVVAKLEGGEPWTMTVIGDSTGNDRTDWVFLLAEEVAADYGRAVEVHTWIDEDGAFDDGVAVGQGDGPAVEIWNASVPGMGPHVALEDIDEALAHPSDLLVINHAHNFKPDLSTGLPDPEPAVDILEQFIDSAQAAWDEPAGVAVILQNPRLSTAEAQDAHLAAVRERFTDREGVTLVDVESAFRAVPDLGELVSDGVHPNAAGQALWTDVVVEALGF